MAKKLTADEMKWILSIDATEAQQAYRDLTKDSRQLTSANKELRDKMLDLVAAGKKESEEYKRLDAELKKNNASLGHNKTKMAALEKTMGITNLTMSQLRKRAKDLQRQLDNTSQATHPEVYKKLDAELASVRSRMDELKTSGQKTQEVLSKSDSIIGKGSIAVALGNIWTKAIEFGAKAIGQIKDFTTESIKMAGIAPGIERAFNRISNPKTLAYLKEATNKTVSNLNLMKTAVKADNFEIPLETLGKMLQFAQRRAKDTGDSVEYMTNSIVDGVGRKSPLILDNLGISVVRLNTEVSKTGDFMKAISNIIDQEMSKAGDTIETEADKAEQRAAMWENIQLSIGQRIAGVWKGVTDVYHGFLSVVEDWVKIPTAEKLREEQHEMNILARSIIAASDRTEIRKLLIEEMNRQYPTFLANLDLEKVTNEEIHSRLKDVNSEYEKRIRAQVLNDKILSPLQDKQRKLIADEMKGIKSLNEMADHYRKYMNSAFVDAIRSGEVVNMTSEQIKKEMEFMRKNGAAGGLTAGIEKQIKKLKEIPNELQQIQKEMETTSNRIASFGVEKEGTGQEIAEVKSLIKIKEEELVLANAMPEATEKELIAKNKKIAAIEKEINRLKTLGVEKEKTEKGKATTNPELKAYDNQFAKELLLLKKQKSEALETEEDYNMKVYALEASYYDGRIRLLEQFKKKSANKLTDADFDKQIIDAETKKLEAQQKSQDLALTLLRKNRDKSLQEQTESAQKAQIELEKSLATQQITKEQYDAMQLVLDSSAADNRLAILQQYQSDVQSLELASGSLREEAIKEANTQVLKADLDAAKARSAQQLKLQDLVKDFKSEFKLTTVDEDIEAQLKVLESYYQARKEMALDAGMDILELEKAFEDAKTKILLDGEKQREQIKDKYGLLTMQEKQQIELDELEKNRKDGLQSEEEYQDALTNLRIGGLEAYFKYYKNLVSGAITALQDAELANIDAKYDVEIERAQGNADEVSRLENEKEQKKLDVQKKYANVNFAIKASEIIANTAVAIVKALSELGPIAGPIAAALMGATGAAQLAVANAERKKIMNMTVSGSSSGSSNTGKRVVTGKESGGFIAVSRAQDGKPFNAELNPDKRGYIDKPTVIVGEGPAGKSREWVASNDALENPTVAPIIQLLNESQEKGEIRTVDMNQIMRKRLAGFESGGYISTDTQRDNAPVNATPVGSVLTAEDRRVIEKFIQQLKHGVMAYVLRSELNKEAELIEKSQKIGSK